MTKQHKIMKSSVHAALNAIGDRWNFLIIQQAFRGLSRYEDLREATGASRNTLSNRLKGLISSGIMELRPSSHRGVRQAYFLTSAGTALYDSMLLAWSWAIKWDAVSDGSPTGLQHATCGKAMLPVMVCGHCGEDITLRSCSHQPGPGAGFEEAQFTRMHRKRQDSSSATAQQLVDVADLTSDRWTALVLSTQYFGIHRFDDMQERLNIATNILTDRLRVLVANGVFERRLYEISPPRYEYHLTGKGRDLYPHALSLMLWGDKWLLNGGLPPLIVTHRPCGERVSGAVVCSECREPLDPQNVSVRGIRDRE